MSSDLDEDVALRLQPIPESFMCPISCATMEDPVAWEAGGWISPGRQEVKTMAGSASVEYISHCNTVEMYHCATRPRLWIERSLCRDHDIVKQEADYSNEEQHADDER